MERSVADGGLVERVRRECRRSLRACGSGNGANDKPIRLLVGLSGGADSVFLLLALHALRDGLGFELSACHVHHGLRGASADADLSFCEALCAAKGVSFRGIRVDVNERMAGTGESMETAARELRLEALESARAACGADFIALAHHMDDQAETVLMHLARGSGLDGLTGMRLLRDRLFRPMLDLRRADIERQLRVWGVEWREDESNRDERHRRNRFRRSVIPGIAEALHADPVPALARCGVLLARDASFLEEETERAWRISREAWAQDPRKTSESRKSMDSGLCSVISLKPWEAFHAAIRARLVRRLWLEATGRSDVLESVHVDAILDAAEAMLHRSRGRAATCRVDLPMRMCAMLAPSHLRILPADLLRKTVPASGGNGVRLVESGGNGVHLDEYDGNSVHLVESSGLCVHLFESGGSGVSIYEPAGQGVLAARLVKKEDLDPEWLARCGFPDEGNLRQCFDASGFPPDSLSCASGINTLMRTRRAGDRFAPRGAPGTKKLKDWMIDAKIPADIRDGLPVLAVGSRIVWVIGYRTSEAFRVTAETTDVVILEWTRQAEE